MGDVQVTDAEMQKVEAQVKAVEQTEKAAIEAQVRKEVQLEQRAKELESQLGQQKAALDAAQADAAKAKAEADAFVRQAAEQRVSDARSKQIVDTANPFKGRDERIAVTEAMVPRIDAMSYEQFMDKRDKSRR